MCPQMSIASISVHLLTLELRVPFTTSFGTYQTLTRPFVVIETTDGLRGVGEIPTLSDPAYKPEADPPSVMTSLKEFILPSVMQAQDERGAMTDIPQLRQSYAWIKGAVFAKSGVEAALWDILAQRAGQPLWHMWGGERRSFPVGVSIGGKTVDQILGLAENAVGMGYRRLKVKIWPGFDVEIARALRERYPDILLQVDANSAYDLSNWELLKGLDEFGLLLIEQPLFDDDIVLHSEIATQIKTPICLDESIHSLRDTEAAMRLWEANGVPGPAGDQHQAAARLRLCRGDRDRAIPVTSRGVKTWIGGMLDSAWGKAFNLNFNGLSAIDLPGDHFSPSGAYFSRDIVTTPLAAVDGSFALGDGVSTGLELDWEAFEALGERCFTVTASEA